MTDAIDPERDLVLTRLIDAPREALYRCWTEPALMTRWFTPAPWETVSADVDLRPGGENTIVMRSPDGQEFPNTGVYLEIVPNERIVFTDAFTAGWAPAGKPFFVGIVSFADEDGKTRYTALARHWNAESRKEHEAMGFHDGWGKAADQLEALASTL